MCRELVANWSQRFQICLKILCEFFDKIFRKTVVRRSRDVRANVANLSPRNLGEYTMQNFRDTGTNVVRVPHDDGTAVLRQHVKTSQLSGEKVKLSDIHTNTVRHAQECRATVVRKNENKIHSRESH